MHLNSEQYHYTCDCAPNAISALSILGVDVSLVNKLLILKCKQGTILHSEQIRKLVHKRNGRLEIDLLDFMLEAFDKRCERIFPEMGLSLVAESTTEEETWTSESGLQVYPCFQLESWDFQLWMSIDKTESKLRWAKVFEKFPTDDDLRDAIRQVEQDLVLRDKFHAHLIAQGVNFGEDKKYRLDNCFLIGPVTVFIRQEKFSMLVHEETADFQGVRSVIDLIEKFDPKPKKLVASSETQMQIRDLDLV